jgi:zinc/manganese transport system substrate-binding protein
MKKQMKLIVLWLVVILSMAGGMALPAQAKLNVVATTPELADLAKEVGGDLISVKAMAKPTEDPHFVDPKPSHVVTLNHADALIEGGLTLEVGWLPPLIANARNPKIETGQPGYINASTGVARLEVPDVLTRKKGDIHPMGNPHCFVDPVNAGIAAANIADALAKLDPKSADVYKANLQKFQARLDAKTKEWQQTLAPFKGAKIVTYHKDWVYFFERFGLEELDTLEPLPGIPPSPAHLAEVIEKMRSSGAKVIIIEPFHNAKTAETVASHVNGKVLMLPQQPRAIKGTETYISLMDYLVKTTAAALQEAK